MIKYKKNYYYYYYYLICEKYYNPNVRMVKGYLWQWYSIKIKNTFFHISILTSKGTRRRFSYCIDLAHFPPIVTTDFLHGRQTKVKMRCVKFHRVNIHCLSLLRWQFWTRLFWTHYFFFLTECERDIWICHLNMANSNVSFWPCLNIFKSRFTSRFTHKGY